MRNMSNSLVTIPAERITEKIYIIRGERVMLDSDLAKIYGITTSNFNKAVKRNEERFPYDFRFQLTDEEYESLRFQIGTSKGPDKRSQNATSKTGRGGRRYFPYAFTEHGALMAANVLKSQRAVEASVQVVRAFVKMRNMLASNAELSKKIESLEKKYDSQFKSVFDAIKRLMLPPVKPKGGIGFVETSKEKK